MVGDCNHGDVIALDLKNESVWKSFHTGLMIHRLHAGKPLGIACHAIKTPVYLVAEPDGSRFASGGVPIKGSVEVRLSTGEKHNLFHQSPGILSGVLSGDLRSRAMAWLRTTSHGIV